MDKIVILGPIQQQAEALSTQYSPVRVIFNDAIFVRNRDEMVSSDRIHYEKYTALNGKQEFKSLRKLLREISPDIIYTNGFRHLGMVSVIVREPGFLPQKPIVLVTSHNSWAWAKPAKRFMMALLCRLFADGVFTLATFQEQWLRKLGVPGYKLRTIPNAVDTERFTPFGSRDFFLRSYPEKPGTPVIVNVANINQAKGQDILIKAIDTVKREVKDVRLFLAGHQSPDSPYNQLVQDLIAQYGLEKNVFIMGNVEHVEVPALLRSCDLSVIASWSEVCPFILLESLAVGKATVSTTVGGIPDIIKDGSNGLLVDPGDVEGFGRCILSILTNPSFKKSIEKNARESAQSQFSFQAIGKRHREFIESLQELRRARNPFLAKNRA